MPDDLGRTIEACDRFEAAWREGHSPRIEHYLEEVVESERAALFRDLLALERELFMSRGEPISPDEYHARFPNHTAQVDAAFGAADSGPHEDDPDRSLGDRSEVDRNLLLGLLALQNNVHFPITRSGSARSLTFSTCRDSSRPSIRRPERLEAERVKVGDVTTRRRCR